MTDVAGILRVWGKDVSGRQLESMERFAGWLRAEAIPAGGIGRGERDRIHERHLLDSLAFANGLTAQTPASLLDVGSGVGLPGIPLAILLPDTEVTLLDRSGRRTRLARRAVRVLGLANVRVEQADISARDCEVLTMRAVMDPAAAVATVERLFPASRAVVAISRGGPRPQPTLAPVQTHRLAVIDGGRGMLDPAPWLLIMAPS